MFKRILATLLALLAASAFAAVDVNKATAAELDGVKGIGPALSGKILDERKKGNFKDWTDFVDRVKGVGEGSAAKLSAEGLTVNGSAFKGVAAPAAKPAAADKKTDAKAAAPAAAPATDKATAAASDKDAKKAEKEAKKAEKEAAKKAKDDAKAAAKGDKPAAAAAPAASAAKK